MNVCKLIDALKYMDPDAEVFMIWDGAARGEVGNVWLTRGGFVAVASSGEPVYSDSSRPLYAPSAEADLYWETP